MIVEIGLQLDTDFLEIFVQFENSGYDYRVVNIIVAPLPSAPAPVQTFVLGVGAEINPEYSPISSVHIVVASPVQGTPLSSYIENVAKIDFPLIDEQDGNTVKTLVVARKMEKITSFLREFHGDDEGGA